MPDADNQKFVEIMDKLYPFQREDVERIVNKKAPSHLIANDMGTGKTYEAIALDIHFRKPGVRIFKEEDPKTLVVTPLSTISSWADTFKDLTDLRVCVLSSRNKPRGKEYLEKGNYDVYIINWESLRLWLDLGLKKRRWNHVIADEVHRAKNRKAKQTKALKQIKTKFKTGMSGTPIINRPDEIWSIMNWMWPKLYTSYWRFYERYVDYEIGYPGQYHIYKGVKNIYELKAELNSFMTRRTKGEVLPDLPEKYYTERRIKLKPEQKRPYEQMRKDMIAWVGSNESQPLVASVVVSQLMRLQQFALASCEIVDGEVEMRTPSAKLDALRDIVLDNPGEPIVVFTQFAKMARLTESVMAKQVDRVEVIDGSVKGSTRGEIINDFQEGKIDILIMTIAAGGVGITLTRANKVVFLDRSWSPAVNMQAEDRLHRIGQENAVQVIDLIAEDTVDLGRLQKLGQKWSMIKQLIGG